MLTAPFTVGAVSLATFATALAGRCYGVGEIRSVPEIVLGLFHPFQRGV